MMFTQTNLTLPARDADLADDEIGAGLYVDETLVELDTGDLVAMSVKPHREPNTGGLVVCAWARAVHADGSTICDNAGEIVENEYRATFTAGDVADYGVSHLTRQVLLLMLGEPLDDDVDENGISTGPLKVSQDVATSVSIRNDLMVATIAAGGESEGAGVLFPTDPSPL
ncbi:hypothetical protein GRI62_11915 [Erythrobacter arachoides]|uniref:Uncharacterized protein n=1 Tax=Aurantiacibacter arachoides TaxID=1850444 RepID=A0A845A4E7_9SPHN|nr:hypothetical protein [Aurantiacibacter arachoides]MXO94302.1 hypothetical protein [Aurantiacibacter arachoides]GGD64531.1 hypothetical protein GCM10011411_26060 [Aurantiacibacter arachoides]